MGVFDHWTRLFSGWFVRVNTREQRHPGPQKKRAGDETDGSHGGNVVRSGTVCRPFGNRHRRQGDGTRWDSCWVVTSHGPHLHLLGVGHGNGSNNEPASLASGFQKGVQAVPGVPGSFRASKKESISKCSGSADRLGSNHRSQKRGSYDSLRKGRSRDAGQDRLTMD